MNDKAIRVFIDEAGRHMLKMPNGEIIPGVCKTSVEQDVEQAHLGICNVIVEFNNVILEPGKCC